MSTTSPLIKVAPCCIREEKRRKRIEEVTSERYFRLLYRQNHRITSHSERFIRCLPLPFLHRATSPGLQPSSTRSATLLPTSLLDLYSQHIPTNRRRSSSMERSGTEVHLPRSSPVLT
ncbi:hypothetical protein BHE74_00037492 [Ensete ventricosum]|nr:hypothetical protein BHE74_00037492 [Ensete ventricosum]